MRPQFGNLTRTLRWQARENVLQIDLGHAEFKTGLIAAKIVADQLAFPAFQEVAGVFSGAAGAEVIDDRCQVRKLASSVGPYIGTMGFLCARLEHLYRRFVGVDHGVCKNGITQGTRTWRS